MFKLSKQAKNVRKCLLDWMQASLEDGNGEKITVFWVVLCKKMSYFYSITEKYILNTLNLHLIGVGAS